jgi:hypothetical protein
MSQVVRSQAAASAKIAPLHSAEFLPETRDPATFSMLRRGQRAVIDPRVFRSAALPTALHGNFRS